MIYRSPVVLCSIVFGLSLVIPLSSAPLFEEEDPVEFRLVAPLKSLKKQRGPEPEALPGGYVLVKGDDGTERKLDVQIMARGNYRRQKKTCAFPPYWLNFKKSEVAGTIFADQDKIKVVSHCKETRKPFDDYIYREYLVYKTYNLLTEKSFNVRLARINYEDTESKYKKEAQIAFFIEHTNSFEDRHNLEQVKDQFIPPSSYNMKELCLAEIFQFMASNLDYTFFDSLEECCHNGKAFRVAGETGGFLPVPYDFDMSGLVNPPYAQPNPALKKVGVKKVTDRYFLGVRVPDEIWTETIQYYVSRKAAIYELWENFEPLADKQRLQALDFIDQFYEIIEDPDKLESDMTKKRRSISGLDKSTQRKIEAAKKAN